LHSQGFFPWGKAKKLAKMAEKKVKNESLTTEALESKLVDLKKEQMNQRFQHAAGQMPKTHVMRQTRREIARVKTKLNAAKK
jgi:large subunit ribosomal protein L29